MCFQYLLQKMSKEGISSRAKRQGLEPGDSFQALKPSGISSSGFLNCLVSALPFSFRFLFFTMWISLIVSLGL